MEREQLSRQVAHSFLHVERRRGSRIDLVALIGHRVLTWLHLHLRRSTFRPSSIRGLSIGEVTGRHVRCRSNYLVIRTMATGAMTIIAAGMYLDMIAIDNEGIRFRERVVVTDSRQIDTLPVIPV
jgi:3-phenylpropionate/cinnamic acid dioxygenase small subunit